MEKNNSFEDVMYMKSLVGSSVSIVTVDNSTHVGVIYVIDPVYKTIVLVNSITNRLEFVLHHAIQSFTVLSNEKNEDFIQRKLENGLCYEELVNRKQRLVKWLKHMFLDVKEEGEAVKVEEHLTISPPYEKSDCLCENTIVLERIRNIIDLMPDNFN